MFISTWSFVFPRVLLLFLMLTFCWELIQVGVVFVSILFCIMHVESVSREEFCSYLYLGPSVSWLSSKETPCNVGDTGLIPESEISPEKEMATHSSILAWRIPWPEVPGGLQSTGWQRVGHNWVTMMMRASEYVIFSYCSSWHVEM